MKYYIIFESDEDLDGAGMWQFDFDDIKYSAPIKKFPAEMPVSSSYDFQSYHNGYAKGYNDCLKTLQGQKLGEYDPEKDEVENKG